MINSVVSGIVNNLTVDSGFGQSLMISLARRYRNFNPNALATTTLPTTATVIGGAALGFIVALIVAIVFLVAIWASSRTQRTRTTVAL